MTIKFLILLNILLVLLACTPTDTDNAMKHETRNSSSKVVEHSQQANADLFIPYVYWWESTGPFLGMCGTPYALVLSGSVSTLEQQKEEENFIAQEGEIVIHEILFHKSLKKQSLAKEKLIRSNCFYNTKVKQGDKVLLFIYEYEDAYAIPGRKSVLKIDDFNSPEVQSTKKYIAAKQNPLVIQDDLKIWEQHNLKTALQNVIDCHLAQAE